MQSAALKQQRLYLPVMLLKENTITNVIDDQVTAISSSQSVDQKLKHKQ